MFTGEYRHSVDDKGRIAVPAKFRQQLEDGAFVSDWIDACLAIFPRREFEALAERVAHLSFTDAGARLLQRFLYGSTVEVDFLPAHSRTWAGLEGEAVIVGARDHAEIWSPERWSGYRREMESVDTLAQRLTGLGI